MFGETEDGEAPLPLKEKTMTNGDVIEVRKERPPSLEINNGKIPVPLVTSSGQGFGGQPKKHGPVLGRGQR